MKDMYGPIIVKFAVPISTLFVFDYEEFIKSPNFRLLGKPKQKDFIKLQFEHFNMDYTSFNFLWIKKAQHTADLARECVKDIPNFMKLCEGIIYTSQRDGKCLVAYNTKLIMPLSYSTNGKTWEKVELNLNYLRRVSNIKSKFVPDLSVKPEDFDINNYSFDSEGFLNVKGSVSLFDKKLIKIPFSFGKVDGSFDCSYNLLTSLEGSPKVVIGDYDCSHNRKEFSEKEVKALSKISGDIVTE
jgi:hypothetical protein